jgi:hypothetical protein
MRGHSRGEPATVDPLSDLLLLFGISRADGPLKLWIAALGSVAVLLLLFTLIFSHL